MVEVVAGKNRVWLIRGRAATRGGGAPTEKTFAPLTKNW